MNERPTKVYLQQICAISQQINVKSHIVLMHYGLVGAELYVHETRAARRVLLRDVPRRAVKSVSVDVGKAKEQLLMITSLARAFTSVTSTYSVGLIES